MAVKRIHTYVSAAYTGGTSNLYARIYQVNSSGRPGKLLVDFGVGNRGLFFGFGRNSLKRGYSTAFLLTPGVY